MDAVKPEIDVLIIGGGLAGLAAALEASKVTPRVTIVAKGKVGSSGNTIMTRNGMAAVMEEGYDGDSVEQHVNDTLAGGAHLNDLQLIKLFAGEARNGIERLMEQGVPFLMEGNKLLRKGSPGHSRKRFLTVDGKGVQSSRVEGLAISHRLLRAIKDRGVEVVDKVLITDLLTDKTGRVVGAKGFRRNEETACVFRASTVILATGGIGKLYPVSSNAGDVTGDGYALAHSVGARLEGMEFIQFHPAMILEAKLVVSTALFADGATLRNSLGETFMTRYSPHGDMATRDVMARAIFSEVTGGRSTPRGGVWLDLSGMDPGKLENNYSFLTPLLKGRKMLEVAPAAHFMMGGVVIDQLSQTTVPGLYAAGEVTTGVHGANRLAGNALTEAVVFGTIAGREAAREAVKQPPTSWGADEEVAESRLQASPGALKEIRSGLRAIMGKKVALVRTEAHLKEALNEIEDMKKHLLDSAMEDRGQPWENHQLRLMLVTAGMVAKAALKRKESIGAHYRLN